MPRLPLARSAPAETANTILFGGPTSKQSRIDAIFHDIARTKHEDAARRDRHLLAGLGIAPDTLTLLAYAERTERGKLDGVPRRQRARNLSQNKLDELLGFVARQAYPLHHRLSEIRSRECRATHDNTPLPNILPAGC